MPRDRDHRREESDRQTTRVGARRGRSAGEGEQADSERTRITVHVLSRLPTISDYDRDAHEWKEAYVHATEGYEIHVSACRGLTGMDPDDIEEEILKRQRDQRHTPTRDMDRGRPGGFTSGTGPDDQLDVPDEFVAWHWRLENDDGEAVDRVTQGSDMGTAACGAVLTAPETGSYSVHLRLELEDGEETGRTSVTIRDRLVVSIGDSYASGEGVPDRPGRPELANVVQGCAMQVEPVWLEPKAHRSLESGPYHAAAEIEDAAEGDLVTFLSFATSGATIHQGLIGDQHDWQSGSQLGEVKRTVGDREIDALLISIGGNDVGFSSGLKTLAADPVDWYQGKVKIDTAAAIADLRRGFERLARVIDDLDPNAVLITEYPTGHFERGDAGAEMGCGVFSGISRDDAIAVKDMGQDLNDAIRTAAERHDWTYVGNIAHRFGGHGYCEDEESYFVGFTESCDTQGDIKGTMHPNRQGQRVLGRCIASALRKSALRPRAKTRDHRTESGQRRGGTRRGGTTRTRHENGEADSRSRRRTRSRGDADDDDDEDRSRRRSRRGTRRDRRNRRRRR